MVEALVASTIVAIALLFAMAMFAQEMRLERRARAQQQALLTLETAVQGLRAGALPLTPPKQTYDTPEPPFVALPPGKGSALWVEVTPDGAVPHLFNVLVTVRFALGGELFERSLGTRVWHPDA